MKIIVKLITYYFNLIFRNLYWLYRLSKGNFGKDVQLQFPLKIEGKGRLYFGAKGSIQKNVKIGIAKDAFCEIDSGALLEENSLVLIGDSKRFKVGENFKLGTSSRLFVKNDWCIGNNVHIETNCSIFSRESNKDGRLSIGDGTHIGDFTIIDLVDNVSIGKDVAIGPNCTLYTHDHIYSDKNLPSWKGGLISKPIIIEDGSWIGSGVTILPGVTIGTRAIVAAGSVVTKAIEPNTIYGGIPAKLIKRI